MIRAGRIGTNRRRVKTLVGRMYELGVTFADLHDHEPHTELHGKKMLTVDEYLPTVITVAGPGANRTYGNLLGTHDHRLGQPPP